LGDFWGGKTGLKLLRAASTSLAAGANESVTIAEMACSVQTNKALLSMQSF